MPSRRASNNRGSPKMEKGVNVATKKLFVTIAAKLFGESARFRTKGMLQ